MISVEIPQQPWHTVEADLFHYGGKWFLLVTDAYSKAPFVRQVANTGAFASIKAMKSIFAENGIPAKVISDNGKHFIASSFKHFAKTWGFELVLSSPEYPQGHALIERHIQTVKKCMKKCEVSGYDFDLALLVLRSTPLGSDLPSPAELLQGRRFRTTLPTYVPNPPTSEQVQRKLQGRQASAARQYNKSATEKSDLTEGQHVRLLNKATRRWEPAVVCGQADTPRSYYVQRLAGGVPLKRNRIHLRETRETFENVPSSAVDSEEEEEVIIPEPQEMNFEAGQCVADDKTEVPTETHVPVLRRGRRERKQTEFYKP